MNRSEAAPRLGALLILWLILVGVIALACLPVVYALAVVWSGKPW